MILASTEITRCNTSDGTRDRSRTATRTEPSGASAVIRSVPPEQTTGRVTTVAEWSARAGS